MTQVLFPSRTLPLLEKLAAFTERRHDVLAGNIANISTPGYKTKDLPVSEFQDALKQSIARGSSASPASLGNVSLGAPASKTSPDLFPGELFQAVERPPRSLTFQDASNRSIENEVMEMSKNSLMQNFAIELMIAQFNLMQAVISERP